MLYPRDGQQETTCSHVQERDQRTIFQWLLARSQAAQIAEGMMIKAMHSRELTECLLDHGGQITRSVLNLVVMHESVDDLESLSDRLGKVTGDLVTWKVTEDMLSEAALRAPTENLKLLLEKEGKVTESLLMRVASRGSTNVLMLILDHCAKAPEELAMAAASNINYGARTIMEMLIERGVEIRATEEIRVTEEKLKKDG